MDPSHSVVCTDPGKPRLQGETKSQQPLLPAPISHPLQCHGISLSCPPLFPPHPALLWTPTAIYFFLIQRKSSAATQGKSHNNVQSCGLLRRILGRKEADERRMRTLFICSLRRPLPDYSGLPPLHLQPPASFCTWSRLNESPDLFIPEMLLSAFCRPNICKPKA